MEKYEGRRFSRLDVEGLEVPDPTPMAVPAGFKVPETMEQMMRRLLRDPSIRASIEDAGYETFEESEDFDVSDETFDPRSPYEAVFDPVLGRDITHEEFLKNREVYEKRYMEAHDKAFAELDRSDALRARPRKPAEQSGPKAGEKVVDREKAPDR